MEQNLNYVWEKMLRRLFAGFMEKVAIRTGVPIGSVWLILFTFFGAIYLISDPIYTQKEMIVGLVLWTAAYFSLWLGYRSEFWMDTTVLSILRKYQKGELDDTSGE